MLTTEKLAQITSPHFCAGVVFVRRVVTEAAPILEKEMINDTKRLDEMERFLRWAAKEMPDEKIGFELRFTERDRFEVTVLGPDDCFYGDTLREAIDAGRNQVVTSPSGWERGAR